MRRKALPKDPCGLSESPHSKLWGIYFNQTKAVGEDVFLHVAFHVTPYHLCSVLSYLTYQDVFPVLRYPHQTVLKIKDSMFCSSDPRA